MDGIKMGKIEEIESELGSQQSQITEIKDVVDKVDVKTDVIVESTKAMAINIGSLNKERQKKKEKINDPSTGTIQKRDVGGTIASIVSTAITILMTGWSLWSIMYGDSNPFLAYLSIICQPTIYVMIKTLTGNDIKNHEITNAVKEKAMQAVHKKEVDSLKGVITNKIGDEYMLKEQIARLTERTKINNEKKDITITKLPPTS